MIYFTFAITLLVAFLWKGWLAIRTARTIVVAGIFVAIAQAGNWLTPGIVYAFAGVVILGGIILWLEWKHAE